jgi:phosphopantetheinyl transferase
MNLLLLHVEPSAAAVHAKRSDDDQDDNDIAHVLDHWQGTMTRCCSARCYLPVSQNDDKLDRKHKLCSCKNGCAWDKVRHDVVKFVQYKDRLLALASILLKSRTFHETYSLHTLDGLPVFDYNGNTSQSDADKSNDDENDRRRAQSTNHQLSHQRTIVDLPRTIYGKPYIPVDFASASGMATSEPFDEQTVHPFSLSHQYPFCGLVRLSDTGHCGMHDNESLSLTNRSTPARQTTVVGLDIVVFDPINTRLYDSVVDFCEALSGNFTAREYNDIVAPQMDEKSRLRELYLRWTVKEAYTKALGVGMGYDFGSLEISLDGPTQSIWNWLSAQSQFSTQPMRQLSTTGSAKQLSTGAACTQAINGELPPAMLLRRTEQDVWLFIFLPLYDVGHTTDPCHDDMRGCACVCVGPFANVEDTKDVPLTVEWTSLVDLASWHGLSYQ